MGDVHTDIHHTSLAHVQPRFHRLVLSCQFSADFAAQRTTRRAKAEADLLQPFLVRRAHAGAARNLKEFPKFLAKLDGRLALLLFGRRRKRGADPGGSGVVAHAKPLLERPLAGLRQVCLETQSALRVEHEVHGFSQFAGLGIAA